MISSEVGYVCKWPILFLWVLDQLWLSNTQPSTYAHWPKLLHFRTHYQQQFSSLGCSWLPSLRDNGPIILYILSWHCLFTGRPFHIGSTSITNPKEVSWLTTSQTLSINMLPSEHGCLHIIVYTWSRHRQSLFSHELRQSLTVPYAYILSIHKTGAYSTQSSLSGIVYVFNCFSLYFYQAFCSLIGPLHLWIGSRAHFTPLFKLMFYLQNNQFSLLIAVFSLSL